MAKQDSAALHVAVMPVADCLPFYYAQQTGMFEEGEVNVRLVEYLSQMDCDTAIERSRVEVAYADIPRTLLMPTDVRIIMGLTGKQNLVTAHTKRIRQLKHLNERMVALDRLSASDYESDKVMEEAGLEQSAIYRPQINDIQLRTSMLMEQLVDAALLPEPYATWATLRGNRKIHASKDSASALTCLIVNAKTLSDSVRTVQIKKLFTVYDQAVKQLNSKDYDKEALQRILKKNYTLPQHVVDSITFAPFPPAALPKAETLAAASRWLQSRERPTSKKDMEALLCKRFVK